MINRMVRALCAMCLASVLLAGMAVTVSASEQDYDKRIEEMSKWLDGMTVTPSGGSSAPTNPSGDAATPKMLTGDELKAYTDTMFELVNKEREKVGLASLERDGLLDEAAMIRAAEIKVVDNAGGAPHTRPDSTNFRTVLDNTGIDGERCGENIGRAHPTPQDAIKSWMKSNGHRKNILRENYGYIGIGIYQRPDGKIDWIQIFELK